MDYTNLPQSVARNDNIVAVNSTGQMDLQGQAASESSGHRHFSGTGGQLGFVRAAYQSKGGRAFLCMPSTHEKGGVRKSRVVVDLPGGTIVTVPRTDVMYAVTEYGMVCLKGKSVAERATAMISITHPDFRENWSRRPTARALFRMPTSDERHLPDKECADEPPSASRRRRIARASPARRRPGAT